MQLSQVVPKDIPYLTKSQNLSGLSQKHLNGKSYSSIRHKSDELFLGLAEKFFL